MEERICERDEWSDMSEGGDCDEVICAGWAEPGGEWT